MDAIVCQGLSKRYRSTVALEALDLTVPAGSIFGFLGPNGAGKSTTIHILTTLSRPTAGEAFVAGANVVTQPDRVRHAIGYLPQEIAFPGWMSGREFLRFSAHLAGMSDGLIGGAVTDVLEAVALTDAARRRIGGYSGGMKQRLGLAQALLGRPSILILDEPVSGLDPIGRYEVIDIITGLRDRTTVFFSSHILDDVDRVCDRVAILSHGRLIAQDTMVGLKERYAQPTFLAEVASGAAQLADVLKSKPWVQDVTIEGNQLRVLVRDVAAAERELPRTVIEGSYTLLRYEQVLPSLEDVFIRLVGPQGDGQ